MGAAFLRGQCYRLMIASPFDIFPSFHVSMSSVLRPIVSAAKHNSNNTPQDLFIPWPVFHNHNTRPWHFTSPMMDTTLWWQMLDPMPPSLALRGKTILARISDRYVCWLHLCCGCRLHCRLMLLRLHGWLFPCN